jgi:cytosine/adenosine deaminase-related metal-dependent hydrolase
MRLGAGACRVADLIRAGAPVGLGVDGSASNENANIAMELHEALLLARVNGGPTALDARSAWRLATSGGAECLGRDDCGALAPGKCADVALFRIDDLAHAGIADPLAGLALAPPARASAVIVNGRVVVFDGRLLTADEDEIAREIAATSARLAGARQ